jgi:acetoin utilization protein AcuB
MRLVSEAMERRVVTVPLEATVGEAADAARRAGVDHLLVLDGEAIAGVLCACELGGAAGEPVSGCSTLPVLAVLPHVDVEEAASTMDASGVGCLPVMVGGLVLGVLEQASLGPAGRAGDAPHAGCRRRRAPLAH